MKRKNKSNIWAALLLSRENLYLAEEICSMFDIEYEILNELLIGLLPGISLKQFVKFASLVTLSGKHWVVCRNMIHVAGTSGKPRRVAYTMYKAPLKPGQMVRSSCSVTDCVKPEHSQVFASRVVRRSYGISRTYTKPILTMREAAHEAGIPMHEMSMLLETGKIKYRLLLNRPIIRRIDFDKFLKK